MQPNVRNVVWLILLSIIHTVKTICVDKMDECHDWAKVGECYKNPRYILLHCPKSCSVCGNEAVKPIVEENYENKYCEAGVCTRILEMHRSEQCQDTYQENPDSCKVWADMGECDINPNFMLTHCAKSCGVCTDSNEGSKRSDNILEKDDELPEETRRVKYRNLKMGLDQERLGRDSAEQYHVNEQIKAMGEYAKGIEAGTDISDIGRSLCSNQLAECAYYASKGLCKKRPMFMLSNCPLACLMCEEVEQFNRCAGKTHPLDVPSFVNEDKVMVAEDKESIRSITSYFGKFSNDTGATLVTSPNEPIIYTFESIFSDVETDEILHLIRDMKEWTDSKAQRSDHFDGKYSCPLPVRQSQSLSCEDSSLDCYNAKSEMMKKISTRLDIPEIYFEHPEFVHYSPGGYYSDHYEYRIHDEWKPAGPRALTIYIPLTDPFEDSVKGGSIGFPDLQWTILTPHKGSMVVWSNVDENLVPLPSLKTEILPVTSGDHYFLVTHIHLHDYNRNLVMNCL